MIQNTILVLNLISLKSALIDGHILKNSLQDGKAAQKNITVKFMAGGEQAL